MTSSSWRQTPFAVCLLAFAALGFRATSCCAAPTYAERREAMVRLQIINRGVRDPRVLRAMRDVERHLFVAPGYEPFAYDDRPLPIGHGQTISQPYIVASMTEHLELKGGEKVLEIGTGSGYQAAVLAKLAREVYTIEIVRALGEEARKRLKRLGYGNVEVRIGDGYKGWPEKAPFDRIIVTAAPPSIPAALLKQLKVGGIMVLPVGEGVQHLVKVVRTKTGYTKTHLYGVRFVPMVPGK